VGEYVTEMWNGTSITKMKYFLSLTLYNANSIIHPQRLYGLLHEYKEGELNNVMANYRMQSV